MPYVKRDSAKQIIALLKTSEPGSDEFLPLNSPEIASFLGGPVPEQSFQELDVDLIRVLEDLVDTLIRKNILIITDLPEQARKKLMTRKGLRSQLKNSISFLDDGGGLI
jgi:chromosome segregation ATPase